MGKNPIVFFIGRLKLDVIFAFQECFLPAESPWATLSCRPAAAADTDGSHECEAHWSNDCINEDCSRSLPGQLNLLLERECNIKTGSETGTASFGFINI